MRKNLFCMVLLMAVAMVSFVSCSNDDGGTPKLDPPSPSENGCFGVYHIGQNRYHDST